MSLSRSVRSQVIKMDVNVFSNFLLNHGWTSDASINDAATIYHTLAHPSAEVVLPTSRNTKGYQELLIVAFSRISTLYDTDHRKTLNSIVDSQEDNIRIRIIHEDVQHGSIQLENGLKLIQGARELMASSALSTKQKKRMYIGKMPEDVKEYTDHLRLGQTEVGSYIINVFSKIRKPRELQLFEQPSFDRQVTLQTIRSVEALRTSAADFAKNQQYEVFDEVVEDGVNANVCKAVLDLGGVKANQNVNIEVQIMNPIEVKDEIHNTHFPTRLFGAIEHAHDYFMDKDYQADVEIVGFVFKLARDEDEEAGVVNVSTNIQDKTRKVKVYLSEDQYEVAISAHRDQELVAIRGDLRIEPRRAEMINVASVLYAREI